MTLTIYYDPLSSPCRTVLALLNLAKIPYEKKHVSVFKGETKTPEYLKINPLGKVPAIEDNGLIIIEHEAILRYLLSTYKEAQVFAPTDIKTQVLVDQYYPFHHYSIRRFGIHYFMGYNNLLPAGSFDKESTLNDLENTLSKFDSTFLQDKKYIAGDKFTIADLTAATELFQLLIGTDADFNKVPRVKAYVERVFEDPVIKETNRSVIEFLGKAYN